MCTFIICFKMPMMVIMKDIHCLSGWQKGNLNVTQHGKTRKYRQRAERFTERCKMNL